MTTPTPEKSNNSGRARFWLRIRTADARRTQRRAGHPYFRFETPLQLGNYHLPHPGFPSVGYPAMKMATGRCTQNVPLFPPRIDNRSTNRLSVHYKISSKSGRRFLIVKRQSSQQSSNPESAESAPSRDQKTACRSPAGGIDNGQSEYDQAMSISGASVATF